MAPGNDMCSLTLEDLEKMSTKRILNIKRVLSIKYHECDQGEDIQTLLILKDNCKTVLATREHVTNKGKRSKIRYKKVN